MILERQIALLEAKQQEMQSEKNLYEMMVGSLEDMPGEDP